jgi:hypothetical protein
MNKLKRYLSKEIRKNGPLKYIDADAIVESKLQFKITNISYPIAEVYRECDATLLVDEISAHHQLDDINFTTALIKSVAHRKFHNQFFYVKTNKHTYLNSVYAAQSANSIILLEEYRYFELTQPQFAEIQEYIHHTEPYSPDFNLERCLYLNCDVIQCIEYKANFKDNKTLLIFENDKALTLERRNDEIVIID